jgi:phosphatidylserine/phosphatidylglycerophosphate/cardiolipin synthase-like enzyme
MSSHTGDRPPERKVALRLTVGADHYDEIIERGIRRAAVSVWISTANLKDVHVEARVGTRARARGRYESLFDELGELTSRGVEVRILHAGPPSGPLATRLGAGGKASKVALRRCVRVHMKMIAVDGAQLYLGSANFTGAGLGAKAEGRRNFEVGILTSDELLLDTMQAEFDHIWSGRACAGCKLRRECPKPIDTLGSKTAAPPSPPAEEPRPKSAPRARRAEVKPKRGK